MGPTLRPRPGRATAALLLAGALAANACGKKDDPPSLFRTGGAPASAGVDGGASLVGLDDPPPDACPTLPDGGTCGCLDLPLLGEPPNLYFVLDRSGSMATDGKWTTVRRVLADVIRKLGPRIRVGAALFPDPRSDGCQTGLEVLAPTLGDAPAGTYGPTGSAFGLATAGLAGGGTPTAATLAALTPRIAALPGKTFVILATDGGPNCNAVTACASSSCIANLEAAPGCPPAGLPNCCADDRASCLDGQASVDAVAALAAAEVATYVVGIPGSGPYASVLDAMAAAGGTSTYYDVTSADDAALEAALSAIAAKITGTCALPLSAPPEDPGSVNVYLDGKVIPRDPVNGWSLVGSEVFLLGATCTRVTSGAVLEVRVIGGCPTVLN